MVFITVILIHFIYENYTISWHTNMIYVSLFLYPVCLSYCTYMIGYIMFLLICMYPSSYNVCSVSFLRWSFVPSFWFLHWSFFYTMGMGNVHVNNISTVLLCVWLGPAYTTAYFLIINIGTTLITLRVWTLTGNYIFFVYHLCKIFHLASATLDIFCTCIE